MSAPDEPLECPAGHGRYPASERFCPRCDMPLVLARTSGHDAVDESEARVRARKIRPELTRGPLVRAVTASNQAEAELIQNMLLEEGVPSVTRRSAGFDVPDFLAAGPRDLLVPESGADTARALLARTDFAPAAAHAPGAPDRAHVARVASAVVAGAGLAALIAWALLHFAR
jgi:hypothetical protein